MRYKAAIVGTGRIAGLYDHPNKRNGSVSHGQAYRRLKSVDVIAAYDQNQRRLNNFCSAWGIDRKYSNIQQLLREHTFDVISLCTISQTHYPMIKRILAHAHRPRILFVEKPICLSESEFRSIKKLAKAQKTSLLVNHTYRFHSGLQKVKQILQSGRLGEVIKVRASYYGGLLNNGIHIIDILRMILGSELKVITSQKGAPGRYGDYCVDAQLKASRYKEAKISLESFDEKYYQIFEIEINCAMGRIRILDFAREIYIDRVIKDYLGDKELKSSVKPISFNYQGAFEKTYGNIVKFLKQGQRAQISMISIDEVEKTMDTIWKLKEKAKK